MQELRRIIRKLILEVKPLDQRDLARQKKLRITPEDDMRTNARDQRRAMGLQPEEEQRADRTIMQQYHKELHSTPEGKELIKQFQTGNGVTVWHSIGYVSAAENRGESRRKVGGTGIQGLDLPPRKPKRAGSIQAWFTKYGGSGQNNQISAVATSSNIGEDVPFDVIDSDNAQVIMSGVGFILRGYPAIVSMYDQMTQTLSGISYSLKSHWKDSGIPKRTGDLDGMIIAPNFGYAGEVAVDNWKAVGVYMNTGALEAGTGDLGKSAHGNKSRTWMKVFWDALHTNLPVHVYNGIEHVGTYRGAKTEHLEDVYPYVIDYARSQNRADSTTLAMALSMDYMENPKKYDGKMSTPKLYLQKYPDAGKEKSREDSPSTISSKPKDPFQNPWYLYNAQEEAIASGRQKRDPANDWPDPSKPDASLSLDGVGEFETVGEMYTAFFGKGWENWK